MRIISVRENPEYADKAIAYFSSKWSVPEVVYRDSINHSLTTSSPLPQWYLLEKDSEIIGSTGLITNDFISRMDLYPWICGVFIEEKHRGSAYASLLFEKAKRDALKGGFKRLYLSTGHIGYYEKYGFHYIGQGYHPWGEESRIYEIELKEQVDFHIRPEEEKDFGEIYRLIRTAFKTANVKDGDEQDFAVKLRESEGYIPSLALVAEEGNKIIGHIMMTKTHIEQPDGSIFNALLVAPLSVLLEYRDRGVGSALMQEAVTIARSMGYKVAFLVGDPGYYSRFGYKQTSLYGIQSKTGIPEQYVQVLELVPNALKSITGVIDCC